MRMHNASLERIKTQCNSRVIIFEPRGFTEVPDSLVEYLYKDFKNKGVFPAPIEMPEEQFLAEKRKALLAYLGITLRERIANHAAYEDELRKRGATILEDPKFKRAKRWEKELREVLEQEAPIEEELSFLEAERTKNTQPKVEQEESFLPKKKSKTIEVGASA